MNACRRQTWFFKSLIQLLKIRFNQLTLVLIGSDKGFKVGKIRKSSKINLHAATPLAQGYVSSM